MENDKRELFLILKVFYKQKKKEPFLAGTMYEHFRNIIGITSFLSAIAQLIEKDYIEFIAPALHHYEKPVKVKNGDKLKITEVGERVFVELKNINDKEKAEAFTSIWKARTYWLFFFFSVCGFISLGIQIYDRLRLHH